MSTFSEDWAQCMHAKGMLVPTVEDANEALEFVHRVHSALEGAGIQAEAEVTIGTLIAIGAITGVDEAVLVAMVDVAAAAYLSMCIGCIAAVGIEELKRLFASNALPDFVVAELDSQGVDLTNEAFA